MQKKIQRRPADRVGVWAVLNDAEGHTRHFATRQEAVNHLARFGWKINSQNDTSVTMQYPWNIAMAYGESGINRLYELIESQHKDK